MREKPACIELATQSEVWLILVLSHLVQNPTHTPLMLGVGVIFWRRIVCRAGEVECRQADAIELPSLPMMTCRVPFRVLPFMGINRVPYAHI
jgi:hypothetical protein